MRTDEEMRKEIERIPNPAYRPQVMEDFTGIVRHPGRLRVTIVWGTFYSNGGNLVTSVFPDKKASTFTNSLSAESRLVSTVLVQACRKQFAKHIRTGNLTGHTQVLENLVQGGQVLREAALDVD
ncbi:hypothetical protein B0H13DRAFT_2386596 [Mycena leptocephala]|nr:hypothetical protein B0H13DRAFT_2386596 [Mycena leptocephala]